MRRPLLPSLAVIFSAVFVSTSAASDREAAPLVVVVMDPMSAKLSCDCVKGYAQRKYEKLAAHLEEKLGRKVQMVWSESLTKAMKNDTHGKADLVIGKHSVILADAKAGKVDLLPIAALTGKDGNTTQTGLIVVRKDDPAQSVADLKGYRILFGPSECDEKYAAPIALLGANGVPVADKPETAATCSVAAEKLMELPSETKAAAVISSYAEPLLAGCGHIKQGDLRILATSREVPFITAFANKSLSDSQRAAIRKALFDVAKSAELLIALESEAGFVPFEESTKVAAGSKKKN